MSRGYPLRWFRIVGILLWCCLIWVQPVYSAVVDDPGGPLHWSATKSLWERKSKKVFLKGNALLRQKNETLSADEIDLDLDARVVQARGNVLYVMGDTVIYGDELLVSLKDRTGYVKMGKVASSTYSLSARKLTKLSDKRYLAEEGSYTTCVDCPQSWTLLGEDVDLEFDSYAFMSNVRAAAKDLPLFWLPYLVIPLKTQRQSGVLMPRLGYSDNGMMFVLPFYWAVSRSVDMTFGIGTYSKRGPRLEWEGRYALSPRSTGQANFYFLKDRAFDDLLASRGVSGGEERWAFSLAQQHEFPFGIEEKLQIFEASDSLYPRKIGDIKGFGEGALVSSLSFSRATPDVSAVLNFRRYRNLISLAPDFREFDETLVQTFPAAQLTTNDWLLWDGRVGAGLTLGLNAFTRGGGDYDRDLLTPVASEAEAFRPGIDPIRKATRITAVPTLFTSFHPWDLITVRPYAEYRTFLYSFPASVTGQETPLDAFYRGYLLSQVEVSTELEKIIPPSEPSGSSYKHSIRPRLLYSWIPFSQESDPNHPFLAQMQYASENSFSGYNFDNQDVVPLTENRNYNNYFLPLGNSLTFGLSSQWIEKSGAQTPTPTYRRLWELRAQQSLNFYELSQAKKEDRDAEPLSRLNVGALAEVGQFTAGAEYNYLPYAPSSELESRHQFSGNFSYILEKAMRQRILAFERSFRLGYAFNKASGAQTHNLQLGGVFSLSDYFMPLGSLSYDFVSDRLIRADGTLSFQSPSRCYKVDLKVARFVCDRQTSTDRGVCSDYRFEFSWNLTGAGFSGLDNMATAGIR